MRGMWRSWLIAGLLASTAAYAVAEDLVLTTYYPSPRGVYNELRVNNLLLDAPGDLDVPGSLAVGPGVNPGSAGQVFIDGQLGIGAGASSIPSGTVLQVDGGKVDLSNADLHMDLDHGLWFDANQQTGFWARSSTSSFHLKAAGTDIATFAANGRVGIGTSAPLATLHIQETTPGADAFVVQQSTNPPAAAIVVRDGKVQVGVTNTLGTASLNIFEGASNTTPLHVEAVLTPGPAFDVDYAGPGLQAAVVRNRTAGGTAITGEQVGLPGNTTGVWGIGDTGVRGTTFGSSGYAGYFEGSVRVTNGYLQAPLKTTNLRFPPPAQDCDDADEAGRLVVGIQFDAQLWVCLGVRGWELIDD